MEFPRRRHFVVFFYWDGSIGYKSRTYSKGYGIKWDAIGNMLRNTLGTWETCWENTLRTCWELKENTLRTTKSKKFEFTIKSPKFTIEILHPSIKKEFQAMISDVVKCSLMPCSWHHYHEEGLCLLVKYDTLWSHRRIAHHLDGDVLYGSEITRWASIKQVQWVEHLYPGEGQKCTAWKVLLKRFECSNGNNTTTNYFIIFG